MTSEQTAADKGRARIVRELHELIDALDRRVPHVERVGELAIARTAATLKDQALSRIATLEHEADADADAIASWSDDGGGLQSAADDRTLASFARQLAARP